MLVVSAMVLAVGVLVARAMMDTLSQHLSTKSVQMSDTLLESFLITQILLKKLHMAYLACR